MTKDNLKCLLACVDVDFLYDIIVEHDGLLYLKKDGRKYGGWRKDRNYNDDGERGVEIVIRWCVNRRWT